MRVFWKHGYEGTSLPALTAAMRINRPSLYAAFGNKEALFFKALARYFERAGSFFGVALAEPTIRRVVERLLLGGADAYSSQRSPRGCFCIQGGVAGSADSEPVRKELIGRRLAAEAALRSRFERAIEERDLPLDANAATLARFVMTVLAGISIQATNGTHAAALRQIAELAAGAIFTDRPAEH